ncbi:uncharacterized protein LOC131313937 [Rhododendron vialii]|uniref:uncharacterized protein LOC131313937 n=1 Tax=Rhododendron vialii TaxID=182163 RepID=UPI00265F4C61|nr:uncharacterized protein LOC131313937 [Rhododendron vialii]
MDFVTGLRRSQKGYDSIWVCQIVDENIRLHGAPVSIVAIGILYLLTDFDRVCNKLWIIQTLEDMLRACVMDFKGSWDAYMSLMEFAYSNSYQSSIGMAPYEALYDRTCRTPICWSEVGERWLSKPELVQVTVDKIKVVLDRLKIAQSCQKFFADKRRRDLEFTMGDWVFLRVSPWKGVMRFKKKGKLSPRYIGPYEIIEGIGSTAYCLALPPELS